MVALRNDLEGTPKMAMEDWKKDDMKIIIVGSTGVGKTMFMSYIDNMCRGRTIDTFTNTFDEENESGGSGSESQTQTAILYHITCAKSSKPRPKLQTIGILDTPGLGDTRGVDRDNQNKRDVAEKIRDNLEVIDAVIILANGTQERLDISTNYALENVSAMFPKSLINNIGFVFTNVSDPMNFNFQLSSLPKELQNVKHWLFQNPLAILNKYKKAQDAGNLSDTQLRKMRRTVEDSYGEGLEVLNDFLAWIDQCSVQPTKIINDLYIKLNNIDTEITTVLSHIDAAEKQRSGIKYLHYKIEHDEKTININKEYEKVMTRKIWDRKITTDHNTLCTYESCHSNCHLSCTLQFLLSPVELGNRCNTFLSSSSERGGNAVCDRCHHKALYHRHFNNLWEEVSVESKVTDEKARKAYEDAKTEKDRKEAANVILECQLKDIEEEIKKGQEKIEELCLQYEGLAISNSFSSYIQATIKLLQQRYDTRSKVAAPQEELDRLTNLIDNMKKRYEVVNRKKDESMSQQRYEAGPKAGAPQKELGTLTEFFDNVKERVTRNYLSQPRANSAEANASVATTTGFRTVLLGITQGH